MMKRICFHWTAGTYTLSTEDYEHYHFTVGKEGTISAGKFKPEANIPPLVSGRYAAHLGGGNSYTVGIGLRGMAGFEGPHSNLGRYPLTRKQCESGFHLAAELSKKYGIAINPDTIFTHYEFGLLHPETPSAGKIDITYLPYASDLKPSQVGQYVREKVEWYRLRV